jgi:hypothetical protein
VKKVDVAFKVIKDLKIRKSALSLPKEREAV